MDDEDRGSPVNQARSHSLADLLRRTSARYPDKVAVIAGTRRATFATLQEAVEQCAAALHCRGLVKGDRLALLSHNNWEFAVLTFAAARLGVVLVPLNFMLTANDVGYILDHAGVSGMV